MSATATGTAAGPNFYRATIGKKIVMAITGLIWAGFTVAHMAGNLGVVRGSEHFNAYAALLRTSMPLLWTARGVLILALVLHVRAALQLYALKAQARPVAYAKKGYRTKDFSSRFMIWSGYALAAFIVFHILHLTLGVIPGSDFVEGDVFHNVSVAFHNPIVVLVYIVSMGFLFLHLNHGLYSFTQSLGLSHPGYAAKAKVVAVVLAAVIAGGFALAPIAVMANVIIH